MKLSIKFSVKILSTYYVVFHRFCGSHICYARNQKKALGKQSKTKHALNKLR